MKLIQNVKSMAYGISKPTFSGSGNATVTSNVGWMVYKIAIVSCKQLFQTFMNANQHTGHFTGSNHEYTHFLSTLQWYTVLTGSTLIPSTYAICCDIRPQGSLTPGKPVFLWWHDSVLATYTGSTMNMHFLSTLYWRIIVLTGST